jgi:uncharacterized protein YjdB
VATVNASGEVTAIGKGSATITAETQDGNYTDTCDVTVTVAVTGISLNKTSLALTVAANQTLTATVNPADATNKTVTWTTNNSSVATVDAGGKVTAVGAGSATITAETQDGNYMDTCDITVTVAAESISLNKTSLSLAKGKAETLIATVLPSDATNKTVTWSTNKSSVATVTSAGKVTAVEAGSATITAKTNNGKSMQCYVTVTIPVTKVTVSPSDYHFDLINGNGSWTVTFFETIEPSDATSKSITWTISTSVTSIASISGSGIVKIPSGQTTSRKLTVTATATNGVKGTVYLYLDAN